MYLVFKENQFMNKQKFENIKFKAQYVVFETDEGFKIIKGKAYDPNTGEYIGKCSAKGNLFDVEYGDEIFATGTKKENPQYGLEFNVSGYVKNIPMDKESILTYLKQGNIAGISKRKAKIIVDKFGDDTLKVLVENINALLDINGIGKKTIKKIEKSVRENLQEQQMVSSIMAYIQNFDISPAYARKIYARYGINSISVLKENPYKLADDVKGIGFLKADEIARSNGVKETNPLRIRSAILYVISQMNEDGHVFGYIDDVKTKSWEFLDISIDYINKELEYLIYQDDRLVCEDDALYLKSLYTAETKSAEKLQQLIESNIIKKVNVTKEDINHFGEGAGIEYAEKQIEGIITACKSNVMILTGGPGTGKTTTVNAIIHFLKKSNLSVSCAAPTGKAAQKMTEATGENASTIHKLLEAHNDAEKGFVFGRNETNKLDSDVLIVDESSMIDMSLMYNILKAVPERMKLIFVGDIDQLPSVGCGNVLNEMIASNVIPVVKLSFIFRQGKQSKIKENSHIINEGHMPDLHNQKDSDFFFINTKGMEQEAIRDNIIEYVCNRLPKYYNIKARDIQILAPMKKGPTGVYELNSKMQEKLTAKSTSRRISNGDTVFRIGDKILYTKNDYDKDVYNGDVGLITDIIGNDNDDEDSNSNNTFVVDFGNKMKAFKFNEASDFVLAYAMTIHKSQGSEYNIVVMPLTYANYVMLQRNLLYTGVTRAKKVFVLFGEPKAIATAVHNQPVIHRNTRFGNRIKAKYEITEKAAS